MIFLRQYFCFDPLLEDIAYNSQPGSVYIVLYKMFIQQTTAQRKTAMHSPGIMANEISSPHVTEDD